MLRFTRVLARVADDAERARAVRLRLAYEERVKSRLATMSVDGTAVALLLPRGTVLRDGALLATDPTGTGGEAGTDGGSGLGGVDAADAPLALVEAAPQPLVRVTAADPLGLLRAAYHLANRHVPAQLAADALLIERDPVLERMLAALGARLEPVEAPFDPEPGAYDGAGHSHAHAHGHGHAHGAGGADADAADRAAGALGEQLSIEAHRMRGAAR